MRRTRAVTPDGVRIKLLLMSCNLTEKEVAEKIGKTGATICDIISGKNKSRVTLHQILRVLEEEERARTSRTSSE